jgi:DNA-directed RNA polymerase subunit RPC12/RpoP
MSTEELRKVVDSRVLVHTSSWRWIHTCTSCGDHTDDDEHRDVCPKCGHRSFTRKVGRWLAFYPKQSFWRDLWDFLLWNDPTETDVEFNVEYQEQPTHD